LRERFGGGARENCIKKGGVVVVGDEMRETRENRVY
jgi:hypothetical protein